MYIQHCEKSPTWHNAAQLVLLSVCRDRNENLSVRLSENVQELALQSSPCSPQQDVNLSI
jgi:hypothetical protein